MPGLLMDIQMPVTNGYKATWEIRAMDAPHCRDISILAMMANAFEEVRRETLAAKMNRHLAKSIHLDTLLKTLSTLLK